MGSTAPRLRSPLFVGLLPFIAACRGSAEHGPSGEDPRRHEAVTPVPASDPDAAPPADVPDDFGAKVGDEQVVLPEEQPSSAPTDPPRMHVHGSELTTG